MNEQQEEEQEEGGLNEADLAALRKFVNLAYLSDAALEVRGHLKNEVGKTPRVLSDRRRQRAPRERWCGWG